MAENPVPKAVSALVEEHRRKLTEFNRTLAAAIHMRDTLQSQVEHLESEERAVTQSLRTAALRGDEAVGASLALRLQAVQRELQQRRAALTDAAAKAADLGHARELAIESARRELKDSAGLAVLAQLGVDRNKGD